MSEEKKELVRWFTRLQQGQIYAYAGILLCIGTFISDEYSFIDPDRADIAYYTGLGLATLGTILSVWRKVIEGRQNNP